MSNIHKIQYGKEVISYDLTYSRRKTLEISVYPDLSVKVKAPENRSFEEIRAKIMKRASWIIEQKYFFSLFLPKQPVRQYISGETHSYLGRNYRLKLINSENEEVKLVRGIIYIYTKDRSNAVHNKKLLEKWYKDRAKDYFEQRLDKCIEKVKKYNIRKPPLTIRNMSKRWGSCSKNGVLTLNTHLIKSPSNCIDYVITHELCHLKYFGHSKAFYGLLVKMMPDWEKRKKRLEKVLI